MTHETYFISLGLEVGLPRSFLKPGEDLSPKLHSSQIKNPQWSFPTVLCSHMV